MVVVYRIWHIRDLVTGWIFEGFYTSEQEAARVAANLTLPHGKKYPGTLVVEESTLDDGLKAEDAISPGISRQDLAQMPLTKRFPAVIRHLIRLMR